MLTNVSLETGIQANFNIIVAYNNAKSWQSQHILKNTPLQNLILGVCDKLMATCRHALFDAPRITIQVFNTQAHFREWTW